MQYPYFIACAEHATSSADVNKANRQLALQLMQNLGVDFKIVRGAYDGTPEVSLAIYGHNAAYAAFTMAREFDQESVLRVDGYSDARLLDRNGKVLAVFTQRGEPTADNYTEIDGDKFTFTA